MKVIHTYVDKQHIIWKELLYVQYLSAILAKKHYGNISFYGDEFSCNQVRDLGLPYDEINCEVLKSGVGDTWSIPKIKVYESIKEPFLHIDTDTLLFNKILFDRYENNFMFSHRDMFVDGRGETLKNLYLNWFSKLNETDVDKETYPLRSLVNDVKGVTPNILLSRESKKMEYDHISRTYTNLLFELMENLGEKVFDSVHIESIPNMNITYIRDYETFGVVCRETLNHYEVNKEKIDKEIYGSCYIEQLVLHTNLRLYDKKYKKSSKKGKNLIFCEIPTTIHNSNHYNNNVPKIEDVKFPFKLRVLNDDHFKYPCSSHEVISSLSKTRDEPNKFSEFVINDINDIKNYFDYEFNGFFHTTYMKWYDIIQVIIIDKLRKEVGDDKIREIHNHFKEIYPEKGLPIISGGELLYEQLTGFKFNPSTRLL